MKKVLLSTAVAVLVLTGCGEDKKATSEAVKTEVVKKEATALETAKNSVVETVSEVKNEAVKATNEVVEKASEVTKETVATVVDTAKEVVANGNATVETVAATSTEVAEQKVEEVKEATKEVVSNVVEATTQKAQEVKENVTEAVAQAVATTEVAPSEPSVSGEALFKACSSCHGQKAEKQALGKSQVIAGWDKQKVIDALNGYKDGTYGGVMKGIMKGQVSTKSDAEIEALADFISTL